MNDITSIRFFDAGNAIFTVTNPSGKHYTFRIRKPKPEMPFFVQLLTGPDNTEDFTYMGVYVPAKREMRLTQKSKVDPDSIPVRVFNWAVKMVEAGTVPEGYKIQHAERCARCGRRLTVSDSITSGFGPECINYVNPSEETKAEWKQKIAKEAAEFNASRVNLERMAA
jgi:hypothetical protein